jgi:sulfur relay (sulfurtransferase) DsrC/TusE family protein
VELDDTKWQQILKARVYYEEHAVVPPIRKFSKYMSEDQKAMFKMWMTGPMKPITKYGGLPKPVHTGSLRQFSELLFWVEDCRSASCP